MAGGRVHCPVCGRMVPGDAGAYEAVYGEHTYRLCSPECRQVFIDNPATYLSKTH